MKTNTLERSSALNKRKIRLLLDRDIRNKYVSDQIKIGLRNQLRALRDERRITQKELAESIGTKQSVISRIEKDPIRVGLPVFLDIANKIDVALVVRFEAIDTFVDWYDNPTVKKLTPGTSESILRETAKALLSEAPAIQIEQSTPINGTLTSDGTPVPSQTPTQLEDVPWLKNVDVIDETPTAYNPVFIPQTNRGIVAIG